MKVEQAAAQELPSTKEAPLSPAPLTPEQRLNAFLQKGANERTSDLTNQYSQLQGLIGSSSFGRPSDASGAVADRLQQLSGQSLDDSRQSLLRQVPFDYAQRQGGYQNLANLKLQTEMERELGEAQKRALAEQKKKALQAGVFGLAGTIGGGIIGGAPGAQIGGGIGTAVGGS